MLGVKRSNQERMAWFNPPTLRAGRVEDLGTTPAYAIHGAATSRRIWKPRPFMLVIPAQAGIQ